MEQLKLDEGINSQCKGIYFKGEVTLFHYKTKEDNFRICEKRQLRFLKRKSCSGCPECGWFWDNMNETLKYTDLENIEQGQIYYPQCITDSKDEMGNIDDWHIKFIKCETD